MLLLQTWHRLHGRELLTFAEEKIQGFAGVGNDYVESLSGVFVQQQFSKCGALFRVFGWGDVQVFMQKIGGLQIAASNHSIYAIDQLMRGGHIVIEGVEDKCALLTGAAGLNCTMGRRSCQRERR